MGLISKYREKRQNFIEKHNKLEEYVEENPGPQRERKFDEFQKYAQTRKQQLNRGNYAPTSNPYGQMNDSTTTGSSSSTAVEGSPYANDSVNSYSTYGSSSAMKSSNNNNVVVNNGVQYEESYQEYKARMAREKAELQRQKDAAYNQQADDLNNPAGDNGYNNNNSLNNQYGNSYGYNNQNNSDDLNAPSGYANPDDLNAPLNNDNNGRNDFNFEQQQVENQEDEDDEELKDIKGELSFTRDKSLAATQRILSMAQDAEISGKNTLGMLGSQSERLFQTEDNLRMAHSKNKIGSERAKELRTAGNLIRAPQNPFNKKARQHQRDLKVKADVEEDQRIREENLQELHASERRVKANLTNKNDSTGAIYSGQTREERLRSQKPYLFDGEDESEQDKELQIGDNLNQIHDYAKRLKKIAVDQSDELDRQSSRMNKMGNSMDKLNIGVNQNTDRLRRITGK